MFKTPHLLNVLQRQLQRQYRLKKIPFSTQENYENGEYRAFKVRDESLEQLKARLVYQSRKRGILENDLLLSTFISKYLRSMTEEQLHTYDKMINTPSNEWDLYYWATNAKPTPKEFESDMMTMFKIHVKNLDKEVRLRQPDLSEL